MTVKDLQTGKFLNVKVIEIGKNQLSQFRKKEYFFEWKAERDYAVVGQFLSTEKKPIGLMSFEQIVSDKRIHIRLICANRVNVGKNKRYAGIVGNMMVYASMESLRLFGAEACVTLLPKTELTKHYCQAYGFRVRGKILSLELKEILVLIAKDAHNG
jgi:hypothetical protein